MSRFRDDHPVSAAVAEKISRRAVAIARSTAPRRTGEGAAHLLPMRRIGEVGIRVPKGYEYMIYQEEGIRPFVMHSLKGKTIPIRTAGGVIFRHATRPGARTITSRDERGRIVSTHIAWRHPGLQPKHFMRNAIDQAISEWKRETTPAELKQILMENPKFKQFVEDWEAAA